MTNSEIKNVCEVLRKLNLVTEEKLQATYPKIYPKPNQIKKGYRQIRMFDTNIHIYETSLDEHVDVTLGKPGKLEKLSAIDDPNIIEICKINGGFFNTDGSKEHLGLFMREGQIYNNYDNVFITFVYYKNGTTEIRIVDNYEWINYWKYSAYWAIGTSYSLVRDGKIDIVNANHFAHSKSVNPRTMIGQLSIDKTFILAVADGRNNKSNGLTATQQAEVMLSLGCINAANLDGGGSTQMIVNDKIVNVPSDGFERSIGSAIYVRKK